MIVFWIVAGVLSAGAAGLVLRRAAAAAAGPDEAVLPVYRRQLAEIEDLAARGLIAEAERRSAESEAGRRLLAAAEPAPVRWSLAGRNGVLAGAILAPLAAAGLYLALGSPGTPDQPMSARLEAWRTLAKTDPAELSPPEMAQVLESLSRERPNDPDAFRFLAMAEAASGDAPAAVRALQHAISLAPQRPDLWERLGEALLVQAEGEPTPQVRAAFREALARDPKSVAARFHLARARVLDGDKAGGIADLKALQAALPADDPRHGALSAAMAELAGGPAPAAPAAPSAVPAIQGMVAGLAARLKAQPNDAEGWVRLVRSYAVLGDATRRDAALARAKGLFAGKPHVLSQLDAAARAEPMK
jgi:cytochrome c-type biogenesis protein CcmH